MSNIAKFCIRHKVTTLMAVIMISIFGVVFTTQLQMALLPDMEAPAAIVMCYYNGATPTDMEELVNVCDRVLVMDQGAVKADLSGERLTEENILKASIGDGVA